jgi:hypothetical protein
MTVAYQELITSLELLEQTKRGVTLEGNPDRLCAIDNQTIQRAEKALANVKKENCYVER